MKYNLFLDDLRNPGDAYISGYRQKDTGLITLISLLEESGTQESDWVVVRDYYEFINRIFDNGVPELISFDHDLHPEHMSYYVDTVLSGIIEYEKLVHKTGYHCAKVIAQTCKKLGIPIPKYFVHSANSTGSENIRKVLEEYEK